MIFVPFIYLTLLTIYFWSKSKAFDTCVFITGMYALTACLAMIVYLMEELEGGGILYGMMRSAPELGIIPTIVYCVLLTVVLWPLSLISESKIKRVVNTAPWTLNILSWLMIAQFLLTFYLVADSTMDILNGDLSALRASHYNGELSPAEQKALTLPRVLQYFHYATYSTILSLPLFFYYTCFEKRALWFRILLFISSFTMPIAAIQAIDRTEFVFYGLMMMWCLVFFFRYMTTKQKVRMGLALTPVAVIALAYFVAVTVARFDDDRDKENNSGPVVAALQYAGQGYLNFCYFWEYGNADNPTIERILPMTSHTLFHVDSTSEQRLDRGSRDQGFFISVFGTFLGDILIDVGFVGLIVWVTAYLLLFLTFIGYRDRTEIDVGELLVLFLVVAIPLFGLFYYRYYLYTHFFTFSMAGIAYFMSKVHFKF